MTHSSIIGNFNAAGAHATVPIGEDHQLESHLIPLVLQVALGQRRAISVFGTDDPTKDGTCVRDYIRVLDLVEAHYLAVIRLRTANVIETFNLGNGQGFTVREVVHSARQVTGCDISVVDAPRRMGDSAMLVASANLAKQTLGWSPQYTTLTGTIETAWVWHRLQPLGYATESLK